MKEAHIMADVAISKQPRSHAVVEHDGQAHRWYNSMVECLRYAFDQGHSAVTVSDEHGSMRLVIIGSGGPVP